LKFDLDVVVAVDVDVVDFVVIDLACEVFDDFSGAGSSSHFDSQHDHKAKGDCEDYL